MFHRQYRAYSHLMTAADVLLALPALCVSYYLRYYLVRWLPLEWSYRFNPELLPLGDYLFYFMALMPFWLLVLITTQRYSAVIRLPLRQQVFRVLPFGVAAGLLIGFFSYTLKLLVSRPVVFGFLLLVMTGLVANRLLFHWLLRGRTVTGHDKIHILIVGNEGRAQRVAGLLDKFKAWGYHVVGYLTSDRSGKGLSGVQPLGSLHDLPTLLQEELVVDEVIFVGSDTRDLEDFEELIRLCDELGIRTRVAVDLFPTSASKISLEFLENLPLLTFSTVPDHDLAIIVKRIADVVIAIILLVLLSPLMLAVALLIKLSSPGPVFYGQVRCGRYGRRFELVKFRTMVKGAEDRLWEIKHLNEMQGPVFKMRNDPRVTRVGRYLRKFSVDELPQLWNVIRGEMSLVGPRAPLQEEVKYYALKQRRRLSVKPGITCLWQVSGRSDIDFHRWMEMDLQYIDNWSFWLDLRIMLKTIPAVFTGRGAR